MARRPGLPAASSTRDTTTGSAHGVSRIDVVCGPNVVQTVLELTQHWADECALPHAARARLTALVRAAVEHGLRFDPRGVTLLIGREARGRVCIDVRWHGSAGCATAAIAEGDVGATIATLDALADEWGFAGSGTDPVHWMVVDAR
jgi:hypothetical protein